MVLDYKSYINSDMFGSEKLTISQEVSKWNILQCALDIAVKSKDSDVLIRLMRLFEKYAKRKASPDSQMCLFWSTSNPPDILQNTRSLDAIEAEFDILFSEIESVTVYDMSLHDASHYIQQIIFETKDYDSI